MRQFTKFSVLFGICLISTLPLRIFAQNGIWQKIENAGDYPDAHIVTIFDSTNVDVRDSGLSYVHFHRLIKILSEQGAVDKRVLTMNYDPLSAYVEIQKATIYRKDGSIEEVDLGAVRDYPAPARAIYWGARQKMLELGRLQPGDAIEVRLFRKGFTYALLQQQADDERYVPPMRGHFYDIVPFWTDQPIKEKVYRVWLPEDKELQYQFQNGEVMSSIEFMGDKTLYTFTKKDLRPFTKEPNMVAATDVAPELLLSTSPDWFAKSRWFYGVNEDYGSFEVTEPIRRKVEEILQGADSDDEKIYRLTHWVADEIRYSGLSMGEGEGYTLHKGSMTFRDRCGVCKDKAGMLVTMLRAAGFESYAAMTMAGSKINDIPADQFNHSVTVVKRDDGTYQLLDPTWVPFVRELWSSAEQQQQYLMGLPEGADLKTTPISPPEKHYYRINGTSKIHENGTLTGQFELEVEGQSDARFRRMFVRQFKANWDAFFQKQLLSQFPQMQINALQYDDPYDYSEPLKITVKYRIPDYAVITDSHIIFTPLVASNVFYHRYLNDHLFINTDLKEREYNFRTRCSKLIELNETIELPDYEEAGYIPQLSSVSGSGAAFEGGYQLDGQKIKLNQRITLKKRIYEPNDWPSFRKAVVSQKQLAKEKVVLKR
ncbi:MAG: DUF3857 domain-containing protein [Caldithrix sp.]|nr:DUF3857 domain-containing protein [Caldithrix sp.]